MGRGTGRPAPRLSHMRCHLVVSGDEVGWTNLAPALFSGRR